MMREYMKSLFTLPLASWIWRPCAAKRFRFSPETWQVILEFVGQPITAESNTTGPVTILIERKAFQDHEAGKLLVMKLQAGTMPGVCWKVQRAGVYRSAETPN